MLNWRRDPGYEQRINANLMAIERSKERTKQIENEILRVRNDSEQIEKETEQIRKETEQMKQENARLRILNAKTRHLISCVDQLCFPPESSSIPAIATEPGSKPFLPS